MHQSLSPEALSELMERRCFPRIAFDCPVRWKNGQMIRAGWARNVSENGAGFTINAISAPAIGDRIRLVFELDTVCEWVVDDNASVVRCDDIGNQLCEVGVRLSDISTG